MSFCAFEAAGLPLEFCEHGTGIDLGPLGTPHDVEIGIIGLMERSEAMGLK
jgi:hypothetical protein